MPDVFVYMQQRTGETWRTRPSQLCVCVCVCSSDSPISELVFTFNVCVHYFSDDAIFGTKVQRKLVCFHITNDHWRQQLIDGSECVRVSVCALISNGSLSDIRLKSHTNQCVINTQTNWRLKTYVVVCVCTHLWQIQFNRIGKNKVVCSCIFFYKKCKVVLYVRNQLNQMMGCQTKLVIAMINMVKLAWNIS